MFIPAEVLFWLIFWVMLAYFAWRRFKVKEQEDFEDRDN